MEKTNQKPNKSLLLFLLSYVIALGLTFLLFIRLCLIFLFYHPYLPNKIKSNSYRLFELNSCFLPRNVSVLIFHIG